MSWKAGPIFRSLAQSKLRLCSANHRPGYWSNVPCDWPSTVWAYSKQGTENGSWSIHIATSVNIALYESLCYASLYHHWEWDMNILNSLAPGRSECDSENVIFNLVLLIGIFRPSHDNALWWMPQDLSDDKSTLVQVMACDIRQQAITWANVDSVPCCLMALLGHNELISARTTW